MPGYLRFADLFADALHIDEHNGAVGAEPRRPATSPVLQNGLRGVSIVAKPSETRNILSTSTERPRVDQRRFREVASTSDDATRADGESTEARFVRDHLDSLRPVATR